MRRRRNNGKRQYRKINYDKLLKELKNDKPEKVVEKFKFEEEVEPKEIIEEVSLETRIRSSKLDNKSNLYIYSKNTMVLHDRDCSYAKRISDKDFDMTTEYSSEFKKCKICNTRMILRKAVVASDERYLNSLVNFIIKIKAKESDLLNLFINNNATLKLINLNKEIEIHVNDDTWRIILNDNKLLTLLHNDYDAIDGGGRILKETFHLQKANINFKTCVMYMINYSYEQHLEYEVKLKVNDMIDSNKEFYESLKYITNNMNSEERKLVFDSISNIIKIHKINNNGED